MKTTSNLEKDLRTYNTLDTFFKENEQELVSDSLPDRLQQLIKSKNMSRSDVIKASNLNEVYAYQIFSGIRRPSRDKLLSLCIGMGASLSEIQDLLKRSSFAPLYARNSRDSAIIFAIEHKKSVIELNQILYDRNEDIL